MQSVDKAIHQLKTTRSAFVRDALFSALKNLKTLQLESRHRAGYRKKPVSKNEVTEWENEQVWGD